MKTSAVRKVTDPQLATLPSQDHESIVPNLSAFDVDEQIPSTTRNV